MGRTMWERYLRKHITCRKLAVLLWKIYYIDLKPTRGTLCSSVLNILLKKEIHDLYLHFSEKIISYCGCVNSNVLSEHLIFLHCTFGFIIYNLNSDLCFMHDTYLYLDNTELYRLFAKTVDHSIEFSWLDIFYFFPYC